MDKYIVSARKYRPATFRSVVGQKALTSTLKNAIASDRLAQAYLFCGPRGVGKTSCARIFAKTINCLNPTADGEACCECENCKAIERGTSLNVVELDAASNNSVDDIRDITDQVQTPPQGGKYRVFIIDEVHMLSSAAFNAFLKTLEEPPKYVIFILATTEKHKVLPTILSRCQTYDFRRITIEDMVEQMQYIGQQEGIRTDPRGLEVIARKADGAMRDALSIFDQVAASSRGDITYESAIENLNVLDYDYYFRLVESFRTGDISGALLLYRDVRAKGFDSLFFLNGLADHVRNLMVAADPRTAELLETSKDVAERYTQQAKSLPLQWYYAAMKVLNDGDVQYRTATNKQFLVELVLIRLSQLLKPATPPFDLVDCDYPLGDITGAGSKGRLGNRLPMEPAPAQSTIAQTTI
ncbi:MAG: DNA polymerase III subunit gamma/tau, partial [Muribaculaceae bacterium]|nr:DNA polymerase III subunit gamma/tau [Muribaculaceae bacterium]